MHNHVFLITGTDTGVGKTITTAALALFFRLANQRVAVIKPVQSGVEAGEISDVDQVVRLAGIPTADAFEGVRLPEPLAPTQAAERAGQTLPPLQAQAQFIAQTACAYDVVLVEGAGGVSVALDAQGHSLLDLGQMLKPLGVHASAIVVNRAGLGTLNHTQLTLWALSHHEIPVRGIIVGAAPDESDLAGQLNLADLQADTFPPVLNVLPAGLGSLTGEAFVRTLTAHWDAHPMDLEVPRP